MSEEQVDAMAGAQVTVEEAVVEQVLAGSEAVVKVAGAEEAGEW